MNVSSRIPCLAVVAVVLFAGPRADAFSVVESGSSSRRDFFGVATTAAAGTAVAAAGFAQRADAATAKTGAASPFTGDYDDPNQ